MILHFPKCHHVRASAGSASDNGARAARAVIPDADNEASAATRVIRIADHHSAGMLSRCHHLDTADALAPMLEAIASLDGQSSMTERNETSENIPSNLGRSVLKCKDFVSYDFGTPFGDTIAMADRMSETEETLAFIGRVRAAREAKFKTQKPVYEFLRIEQDKYKHYETKRPLPRKYIPAFCTVTEVSMVWLLTGEGKGPSVPEIPRDVPKRTQRAARGKRAA